MDTDLPESAIRFLIQEHTGPVTDVRRTAHGRSSDLTAIVDCANGPFFVKAVRNRPGGRRDSLIRERMIDDALVHIAPPLLWDVEAEDWLILGYEVVHGRSADFEPDSPDLPLVVDTIAQIGRIPLPAFARDWTETRWDRFAATRGDAELFRGDSLLHTDINPDNILVGGRRAWAVDWAWPTVGAGFIDPALLVVQLIAAGHTPAGAEKWASQLPAWHKAAPEAINAFAAANLLMYRAFAERKPDADWLKAMVEACRSWTDHRGSPWSSRDTQGPAEAGALLRAAPLGEGDLGQPRTEGRLRPATSPIRRTPAPDRSTNRDPGGALAAAAVTATVGLSPGTPGTSCGRPRVSSTTTAGPYRPKRPRTCSGRACCGSRGLRARRSGRGSGRPSVC